MQGQHNKTGGGSWCPSVTDHDYKILNLVKDQVTPLPNTCDSAAVFFGGNCYRLICYVFTCIILVTKNQMVN